MGSWEWGGGWGRQKSRINDCCRLAAHAHITNHHHTAAGEFCVRVVGTVRLPRPTEAVRLTAENKKGVTRELSVGVKNPHLERARTAVLEVLGKEAGVALLRHVSGSCGRCR